MTTSGKNDFQTYFQTFRLAFQTFRLTFRLSDPLSDFQTHFQTPGFPSSAGFVSNRRARGSATRRRRTVSSTIDLHGRVDDPIQTQHEQPHPIFITAILSALSGFCLQQRGTLKPTPWFLTRDGGGSFVRRGRGDDDTGLVNQNSGYFQTYFQTFRLTFRLSDLLSDFQTCLSDFQTYFQTFRQCTS